MKIICRICGKKITGKPRKHFKGDYSCYKTKAGHFTNCYKNNCEWWAEPQKINC